MTVARADRAGTRPRTCCPTHADACRFGRDHTWAGPYLLDAGRPVNGAVWSHAGDVLCSTCGGQCVADRVTGESVGRFEFDGAEGIAFWVGNSDEETAVKVMFSELENLAKFLRFNFPGLFDGTTEHYQRMIDEGKIR